MGVIIDVPSALLQKAGVKSEKNARLVVYSAIAIIAVIGGVIVYKKVKNLFGGGNSYDANSMNDQLSNLDINSGALTISPEDAIIIVNNLVVAMDWFGTDDQAVIDNIARCQTKDDLMLVIRTFGIKLYSGLGLAQNWFERLYSTPKDLTGWIRAEMSGAHLAQVKAMFDNLGVPF
jgi:hypothetical protein